MTKKYDWMTADQAECYRLLADVMRGEHHVYDAVKPYGNGIECNPRASQWATFDFDGLTRLVVLAHDRCIRVQIDSSGPGRIKLVLHRRQRHGGFNERHPTLEHAAADVRRAFISDDSGDMAA